MRPGLKSAFATAPRTAPVKRGCDDETMPNVVVSARPRTSTTNSATTVPRTPAAYSESGYASVSEPSSSSAGSSTPSAVNTTRPPAESVAGWSGARFFRFGFARSPSRSQTTITPHCPRCHGDLYVVPATDAELWQLTRNDRRFLATLRIGAD